MTKTVVSYRARGWVTDGAAHELAQAIMPSVDFDGIGESVMEFPCVVESDDGPCEVTAFAFNGSEGPELRICLRAENATTTEKKHAS